MVTTYMLEIASVMMPRCLLLCAVLVLFAETVLCNISCQDNGGCNNRGTCMLGTCQCTRGRSGAHCEIVTSVCPQRNTSSCVDVLVTVACFALNMSNQAVPQTCMDTLNPYMGIPGCISPTNRSCLEIQRCFPSAQSGNYQLNLLNGSSIEVFCNMQSSNCGGQGGWTRVALVNMTMPGATCPVGLLQRDFSGQTLCSRSFTGCQSTTFSTFNLNYCEACGQVVGYQFGTPEAFARSIVISSLTVDSQYVDGISITHGSSPRTHIWTYAAGVTASRTDRFGCPCNTNNAVSPPSFVGNNYYCESATTAISSGTFYPNDVLWDGQQCTNAEGPCCTNPNLPWFNRTLPQNTNDDIELRMCFDEGSTTEGSPFELVELYIR